MLNIRKAEDDDFDGIWSIFREIVIQGETYAFPPDTNKPDARQIWMLTPTATYAKSLEPIISSRTKSVWALMSVMQGIW